MQREFLMWSKPGSLAIVRAKVEDRDQGVSSATCTSTLHICEDCGRFIWNFILLSTPQVRNCIHFLQLARFVISRISLHNSMRRRMQNPFFLPTRKTPLCNRKKKNPAEILKNSCVRYYYKSMRNTYICKKNYFIIQIFLGQRNRNLYNLFRRGQFFLTLRKCMEKRPCTTYPSHYHE